MSMLCDSLIYCNLQTKIRRSGTIMMHPRARKLTFTWAGICFLSVFGGSQFVLALDSNSEFTQDMAAEHINAIAEAIFRNDYLLCPPDSLDKMKKCTWSKVRSNYQSDQCKVIRELYKCLHSGLEGCENEDAVIHSRTDQVNYHLKSWDCKSLDESSGANYVIPISLSGLFIQIFNLIMFFSIDLLL